MARIFVNVCRVWYRKVSSVSGVIQGENPCPHNLRMNEDEDKDKDEKKFVRIVRISFDSKI